MPSRASIVIPAHNEEKRIGELLASLCDPSIAGAYDVYVVCNGCTDRTREVAEEYSGIVVVEIESVGKHHALNEGDRLAGEVYPRLYCDADIRISSAAINILVEVLTTEEIRVAGPTVRYRTERSAWAVKMFYRAQETAVIAPWMGEHLVGRGLYGASRAARGRFESFPNLTADDLFFDSQFTSTEKLTPAGTVASLWAPIKLRQLIRGEVRVAQGNRQHRAAIVVEEGAAAHHELTRVRNILRIRERTSTVRGWLRELRGADVVPILVYLAILAAARSILVVRKSRGRQIEWR